MATKTIVIPALQNPPPYVEGRFGVAVSTGFRRTEKKSGRTVELFLCPRYYGAQKSPDQSRVIYAELEGDEVDCSNCSERHPVVDFFDAEAQGFIATRNDDGNDGDLISASAQDMAEAIRGKPSLEPRARRPLKATKRRSNR